MSLERSRMKTKSMRPAVAGLALSCFTALTAFGAHAAEPKELFFYNWTDYYPVDLLAKFEKETGIKVTMTATTATKPCWPSCRPVARRMT
jgi:spermidine/putrescine-binding protein